MDAPGGAGFCFRSSVSFVDKACGLQYNKNEHVHFGEHIMKINDKLYESMLAAGREILPGGSYRDLTIRHIAEKCGVSVGTVYNCFSSKEMLAAAIMLKDWCELKEKAETETAAAETCADGLEAVFNTVRHFVEIYQGVFETSGVVLSMHAEQHEKLIRQLSALIAGLLDRFGKKTDPDPARFLAEAILLAGCRRAVVFDDIRIFLERITDR